MVGTGKGKTPARGGKKNDAAPRGPRRTWTLREEEVLMKALNQIVEDGLKCDNGFKTGYLVALEKYIRQAFPDTDIRAQPHIASKIHVWKKDYGTLSTIKGSSGVGSDESRKMLLVPADDVWADFVRCDPNARTMRHKKWPFFDDWEKLFGKDRANGDLAEDGHAAANNPIPEGLNHADGDYIPEMPETDTNEEANGVDWNDIGVNFFDDDHDVYSSSWQLPTQQGDPAPQATQPSQRTHATTSTNTQGTKRTSSEAGLDKVADIMGNFAQTTAAALSNIGKRIGYDMDAAEARRGIFDQLGKMPFLDLDQQVKVSEQLIKDPKVVDLFLSMHDAGKENYVRMILSRLG